MFWKNCFRIVASVAMATSLAGAAILNGGFESGDFNNWSAVGSTSVSLGQDYPDIAFVSPDTGVYAAQLTSSGTTAASLAAQMSITVEDLNGSNAGFEAAEGAMIWQSTYANAGDVIQFRWNFVALDDGGLYDDWSFLGVQYGSNSTVLTRLASVNEVVGGGVTGWTTQTIPITQTGSYTIYFGVVNARDDLFPSDLWIDSVEGGSEVPEPAAFALLVPVLAAILLRSRRGNL